MFDRLIDAIRNVSIPGAPPRMSRTGARIGLSFLDTALRQNHTRRFTEELNFTFVGIADRLIRQEVSLSLLHQDQIAMCREFTRYRAVTIDKELDAQARRTIWVPLARVDRFSSPPVQVLDNRREPLPTLTRSESADLFAPAVYRLFRRIIETNATHDETDSLNSVLTVEHESRWLLQQAIISLITERAPTTALHELERTPGTVSATGGKRRSLLEGALTHLHETEQLDDVLNLLKVTVDDTILIAAIDESSVDHELTYRLPIEIARNPAWAQRTRSAMRTLASSPSDDYVIEYSTIIPSGVKSYHLKATSDDPAAEMRDAALVIPASRELVSTLSIDLGHLAVSLSQYFNSNMSPAVAKLLEYEVQNALKQLADVLRRRTWEAEWQNASLRESLLHHALRLARAAESGEGVAALDDPTMIHASLLRHPEITPENLTAAADELSRSDLGTELWLDTAQEAAEANLTWRRAELASEAKHDTSAICRFRVVDATGRRISNIQLFGLTLLLLTYLLLAGSYHSLWLLDWYNFRARVDDVEAKVAILLLVPGFLFARLDLPPRNTIGAKLRAWPTLVAYVYIGTSLASALDLAAAANPTTRATLGICLLALQFILLLPQLPISLLRSRDVARQSRRGAPSWVGPSRRIGRLFRNSDAAFRAVGITQED